MSVSDGACDQFWGTCMELKSDPQFVATSALPECVQGGSGCAPRLAFTCTKLGGRSANVSRNPEVCLFLPLVDSRLLVLGTKRASGGTQVACNWFSTLWR